MSENFEGNEFPERVMKAYRDYMEREQAWWQFLCGTGMVDEAEAAWVLWGRRRPRQ